MNVARIMALKAVGLLHLHSALTNALGRLTERAAMWTLGVTPGRRWLVTQAVVSTGLCATCLALREATRAVNGLASHMDASLRPKNEARHCHLAQEFAD